MIIFYAYNCAQMHCSGHKAPKVPHKEVDHQISPICDISHVKFNQMRYKITHSPIINIRSKLNGPIFGCTQMIKF